MGTHRLTDTDAEAVLRGHAPENRDDLTDLVAVVQAARASLPVEAPRPSADLAALLAGASPRPSRSEPRGRARLPRRILATFAGLGLGLQIGMGVAAATGAVGAAGMADLLPDDVQGVFDRFVGREDAGAAFGPARTEGQSPPGSDDQEGPDPDRPGGDPHDEARDDRVRDRATDDEERTGDRQTPADEDRPTERGAPDGQRVGEPNAAPRDSREVEPEGRREREHEDERADRREDQREEERERQEELEDAREADRLREAARAERERERRAERAERERDRAEEQREIEQEAEDEPDEPGDED